MSDTIIKGGKRAIVGEVRLFNGKPYIKTSSGWRPQSNKMEGGKIKSADDHVFLHSNGKYAIDTLDPDTGAKKFNIGDKISWIGENGRRYHATIHEKQVDEDIHGLTSISHEDTRQSIQQWISDGEGSKKGLPSTGDLDADDFIAKITKIPPTYAKKIQTLRGEIKDKIAQISNRTYGPKYDGPDKESLIQMWKRVDAYLTHHQSKRSSK